MCTAAAVLEMSAPGHPQVLLYKINRARGSPEWHLRETEFQNVINIVARYNVSDTWCQLYTYVDIQTDSLFFSFSTRESSTTNTIRNIRTVAPGRIIISLLPGQPTRLDRGGILH